ncbi:MAG: hypothetical protein A3J66_03900 [Candidatus Magasanikbacteria bacterium RIFCSPHIGHO2_02_FULL_47_14]|uniref:tRNA carboxymethyluridine synthase n=1 Tax=Candidatus Magasanikbacteria bacterium RIFCSPHIGHO2_02_FULL_47_14 TaxID=1798680 RepID=A0A1F6M7I4_9BACT|nr:MAG: hypothetical protein A3J66_03900 [Candidatus Magasanikbacteria bacterium RIFCSPHIGHO2_02_FULL_47_14]
MQHILETIVLALVEKQPRTKAEFDDIRRQTCNHLSVSQPPNRKLFSAYQTLVKKKRIKKQPSIERLFTKASVRSSSGIAVITSLLKPYACPGKCVYCPTEARMPKSYVATEPAAARSLRLNFDPYLLMQKRIEMLEQNGHPCDKIEYITKGGTWNAYPLKYQYWYVMESFKACNNFTRKKPVAHTAEEEWNDKLLEALITETEKEQRYNEGAGHRIIGITLETRPDAITAKTIAHMRQQGCTRVELGLQATDDRILELIKRGHTVDQFRKAIYLLRSAGFKVDLHFMPDLPGTTPEHDVEMYKQLFDDPALRPDMVKIYPNTVIKTAELYEWYLDGRYKPYGDRALFDALLQMKKLTPRYCRISRLIRDFPATEIEAGNIITNLRELLAHRLKQQGEVCVCLRCREISRHQGEISKETSPQLFVEKYDTIGGTEYFLTFEDPQRIAVFGFLRLRLPTQQDPGVMTTLSEIKECAFIRELHVYGQMVEIGKTDAQASQHKGLGKKLVEAAEKIAAEAGFSKVAVISGVGVRGYYRKLGYKKVGTYMVKHLF